MISYILFIPTYSIKIVCLLFTQHSFLPLLPSRISMRVHPLYQLDSSWKISKRYLFINCMSARIQHTLHPPSTYLFTIRLHSNKPQLCYSAQPKAHLKGSPSQPTFTQIYKQNRTLAHSPILPTTLLSFTPVPQPPQSQITRNTNITLNASSPLRKNLDFKQEESLCQSLVMQESLISGLLVLSGEETPLPTVGQKMGLQQLLIQQTESVRLDSSLTEDEYSEIMPLTEQQRNFFTNFVVDSRWLSDSVFRNVTMPEEDCRLTQLQQRRRVIRNFFKPKGSFLKDDRTCCNSHNNFDSMVDSRRGGSGSLSGVQL